MNRLQTLLETPLVRLARFDHPAEEGHQDPEEESAPYYSINFVERGQFKMQVGKRSWELRPGKLLLTRPGLVYRCRHSEPTPSDTCLSVLYPGRGEEELRRVAGNGWKVARLVVFSTNRLAYLYWGLRRAGEGSDPLRAESLAGELWAAVGEQASARPARLYRERQLSWYAERVEAARAAMATRYAEAHSLDSLACDVGMSPFHFARVFRQLTGTPPHRYLLQVRLTQAGQRLRQGAGVTEICYACGFNNLSHFIRLFRRTFGVPPSQFGH